MAEMVVCVRCKESVPANTADFTADGKGMICNACAHKAEVAGMLGANPGASGSAIAAAERSMERSKHMKHVIIGAVALAVGIPLGIYLMNLYDKGQKSQGLIFPMILIGVGAVELFIGFTGLSKLKKPKK